jgi:uncharacterized protein
VKVNISQIKDTLNTRRDILKKTYKVEDLGIFGSVARGDNTDISDIDVLVRFVQPIGMFTFIELENYLSRIFGKKVDLVTPRALKPEIKDDILQEVIYV